MEATPPAALKAEEIDALIRQATRGETVMPMQAPLPADAQARLEQRLQASRPAPNQAPKKVYPCDVCGADDAAEIEVARHYMTGPLHVCKQCGLVYVRERRSSAEIAEAWTGLYSAEYNEYTPSVAAQHAYIAEYLAQNGGLHNKRVIDIGAGTGRLGKVLERYGATVWHVDPSPFNCGFNTSPHVFLGPIEDFKGFEGQFDIVTMNFTLECCAEPREVMRHVHALLRPNGRVLIGTGWRIMAPITRTLDLYLSPTPPDTHPLRFSRRTVNNFLLSTGFVPLDLSVVMDINLMIGYGEKTPDAALLAEARKKIEPEDWKQVVSFFTHWYENAPGEIGSRQ